MKAWPTPEQLREVRERVAARTQSRVSELRKKSTDLMANAPLPPMLPQVELPKLNTTHEEWIERHNRKHRRRQALAILLGFVVLLLFWDKCEQAPIEPELATCVTVADCGDGEKGKRTLKPISKKTQAISVGKSRRENLEVLRPEGPAWLGEFRLQVSARSAALAKCFQGLEKPLALRFRATVFPARGNIEAPEVEPIVSGLPLTASQTRCLVGALSSPAYVLPASPEDDLGRRVSLVFEF